MEEKELSRNKLALRKFRLRGLTPWRAALIMLLAGHLLFLMAYFEPAISTPDANGYFAQARLIAEHARTWFEPESPLQYIGVHWLRTEDGRYFSRYPPGLPLVLAVVFKLGGPKAALLVNPILTSLTLLGLFMLCRLWIGEGWGLVAVAGMAVNPVTNAFALTGNSHAATSFFLVWGLYLLALWSRKQSVPLAFLAGLWLGMIPTIRYAEVLFGPALGLFMLLYVDSGRKAWQQLAAAFLGALLPVSCLMIHNWAAFGAFWKTGYALTNEQTGFSWKYFSRNAVTYLRNILGEGAGLFAGVGLVGMVAVCTQRETRREGILLVGLVLPLVLVYMAYYWAPVHPGSATMRFLLPVFYIFAIDGVWCLRIMAQVLPRGASPAAAALVAVTACWGLPQSVQALSRLEQMKAALVTITHAVTEQVEPGSIVIAHSRIQQHLDYLGRWRLVDERLLLGGMQRPGFPGGRDDPQAPHPLLRLEQMQETIERYRSKPGEGLSEKLLEDLHAWALPEARVYWIGELERMKTLIPPSDSLEVVAKIDLPRANKVNPDLRKRFHSRGRALVPGARPQLPRIPEGLLPGGDALPEGGIPGLAGKRRRQPVLGGGELVLVKWTFSS